MIPMPKLAPQSLLFQDQRSATGVSKECVLSQSAASLVAETSQPVEFVTGLLERQLWTDALQVLAQLLPERFSVWWGCLCAWHASEKSTMPEAEKRMLEAAGMWVIQPDENRRAAAAHLATAESKNRPPGCLAGALEYASGSKQHRPEIVGRLVAAAVLKATNGKQEVRAPQFVEMALRIGNSEIGWTSPGR